jgi:hypothetical protein
MQIILIVLLIVIQQGNMTRILNFDHRDVSDAERAKVVKLIERAINNDSTPDQDGIE